MPLLLQPLMPLLLLLPVAQSSSFRRDFFLCIFSEEDETRREKVVSLWCRGVSSSRVCVCVYA